MAEHLFKSSPVDKAEYVIFVYPKKELLFFDVVRICLFIIMLIDILYYLVCGKKLLWVCIFYTWRKGMDLQHHVYICRQIFFFFSSPPQSVKGKHHFI